jgi:hypothetical protein
MRRGASSSAAAAAMDGAWHRFALGLRLQAEGFGASATLSALDSPGSQARRETLSDILQREPTDRDADELDLILWEAATFAALHRRRQNATSSLPAAAEQRSSLVAGSDIPFGIILQARLTAALPARTSAFLLGRKVALIDKERRRDRLALKIGHIISDLGLPAAAILTDSSHLGRLAAKLAGGRRLSTLAQKIRTLEKMAVWMAMTPGVRFQRDAGELLYHILERGAVPFGPTVPRSILNMVSFIEHVGGVDAVRRHYIE